MDDNHYFLIEGMRVGDLADLVIPMVSIDEFESKIDDDAVVLGLYVADQDAAADLNRFIQKSSVELLDTDVSPAPDQFGHYMVFVELLANERTAGNISSILQEISPLCGIADWQMEIRGSDDIVPFDDESLQKALDHNFAFDKDQAKRTPESAGARMGREALTHLTESDLDDAIVLDRNQTRLLSIRASNAWHTFELHAVGDSYDSITSSVAEDVEMRMDASALRECSSVQAMLGPNWFVAALGDKQVWGTGDDRYIVVGQHAKRSFVERVPVENVRS